MNFAFDDTDMPAVIIRGHEYRCTGTWLRGLFDRPVLGHEGDQCPLHEDIDSPGFVGTALTTWR